ncbi:MAG: Rdx family protein [Candidatus Shikimatogenerans sp. JK-2022]|nr:Rdx family protein [Candidatus Shikimatogenerans bostrichidophilus]
MMLFFLCNIIEGQLIQSGAFEISFNDVPVWSKLETGRIPQPAELFQIIERQMQFTDSTIDFSNRFAK